MAAYLPLLTFHALDDRGDILSCPASVFSRGVETLLSAGHLAVSVAEVAAKLREGSPLPEKGFAICFDDGYRSVFEQAFPVLERYAIPATIFLTVGARRVEASGALPEREGRAMLSWAQVRELRAAGIEIAAHTLSHPDLTRLPLPEAEAEMAGSRTAIEDVLGHPVRGFSYPYGRFDDGVRQLAARSFDYAVSDRLAVVTPASDIYALERIEMLYLRGERRFRLLRHRALPLYLRALNVPRRLRRSVWATVKARSHLHDR